MAELTTQIDGRDVAMAFRSISVLRESVLEKHGAAFADYVALRQLAEESFANREEYVIALTKNLATDADEVTTLLEHLAGSGLITLGDKAALTPAGDSLYRRLTDAFSLTSAAVYEGMAPADIETTRQVLKAVRDRAEVLATQSA
jgi:hypothetical protein